MLHVFPPTKKKKGIIRQFSKLKINTCVLTVELFITTGFGD